MSSEQHHVRFVFGHNVSMREVEGTLRLARLATESVHGYDRVSLDATYRLERKKQTVLIDARKDVGHMLALIFHGYVRREFGEGAVKVLPAAGTELQCNQASQHNGTPRVAAYERSYGGER